MKKNIIVCISMMIFMLMLRVNASSVLNVNKSEIKVGDTFNVKVSLNDVASWNVHVNATGPVSECIINEANTTDDAKNTSVTFNTTCKATGEGNIVVKLTGDVSNEEVITSDLSEEYTVKVLSNEGSNIDEDQNGQNGHNSQDIIVDVPDTLVNSSLLYIIIGLIVTFCGSIILYFTIKKSSN